MTGEQLKSKLDALGISQAEAARRMGVSSQSFNQFLEAKDVKTGLLENICEAFGLNMGAFYDGAASSPKDDEDSELTRLREENQRLREELRMKSDPSQPKRESEVYHLWMEYMKTEERRMNINNRMFELYQKEKEG